MRDGSDGSSESSTSSHSFESIDKSSTSGSDFALPGLSPTSRPKLASNGKASSRSRSKASSSSSSSSEDMAKPTSRWAGKVKDKMKELASSDSDLSSSVRNKKSKGKSKDKPRKASEQPAANATKQTEKKEPAPENAKTQEDDALKKQQRQQAEHIQERKSLEESETSKRAAVFEVESTQRKAVTDLKESEEVTVKSNAREQDATALNKAVEEVAGLSADETQHEDRADSDRRPREAEEDSKQVRFMDAQTIEEQVVALYQQHDPSKVQTARMMLQQYKGREMDLLKTLTKRYTGSDLSSASPVPSASPSPKIPPRTGTDAPQLSEVANLNHLLSLPFDNVLKQYPLFQATCNGMEPSQLAALHSSWSSENKASIEPILQHCARQGCFQPDANKRYQQGASSQSVSPSPDLFRRLPVHVANAGQKDELVKPVPLKMLRVSVVLVDGLGAERRETVALPPDSYVSDLMRHVSEHYAVLFNHLPAGELQGFDGVGILLSNRLELASISGSVTIKSKPPPAGGEQPGNYPNLQQASQQYEANQATQATHQDDDASYTSYHIEPGCIVAATAVATAPALKGKQGVVVSVLNSSITVDFATPWGKRVLPRDQVRFIRGAPRIRTKTENTAPSNDAAAGLGAWDDTETPRTDRSSIKPLVGAQPSSIASTPRPAVQPVKPKISRPAASRSRSVKVMATSLVDSKARSRSSGSRLHQKKFDASFVREWKYATSTILKPLPRGTVSGRGRTVSDETPCPDCGRALDSHKICLVTRHPHMVPNQETPRKLTREEQSVMSARLATSKENSPLSVNDDSMSSPTQGKRDDGKTKKPIRRLDLSASSGDVTPSRTPRSRRSTRSPSRSTQASVNKRETAQSSNTRNAVQPHIVLVSGLRDDTGAFRHPLNGFYAKAASKAKKGKHDNKRQEALPGPVAVYRHKRCDSVLFKQEGRWKLNDANETDGWLYSHDTLLGQWVETPFSSDFSGVSGAAYPRVTAASQFDYEVDERIATLRLAFNTVAHRGVAYKDDLADALSHDNVQHLLWILPPQGGKPENWGQWLLHRLKTGAQNLSWPEFERHCAECLASLAAPLSPEVGEGGHNNDSGRSFATSAAPSGFQHVFNRSNSPRAHVLTPTFLDENLSASQRAAHLALHYSESPRRENGWSGLQEQALHNGAHNDPRNDHLKQIQEEQAILQQPHDGQSLIGTDGVTLESAPARGPNADWSPLNLPNEQVGPIPGFDPSSDFHLSRNSEACAMADSSVMKISPMEAGDQSPTISIDGEDNLITTAAGGNEEDAVLSPLSDDSLPPSKKYPDLRRYVGEQLLSFYKKHNASKPADDVDRIADKFLAHDERPLAKRLSSRYPNAGPDLAWLENLHERKEKLAELEIALAALLQKQAKARTEDVEDAEQKARDDFTDAHRRQSAVVEARADALAQLECMRKMMKLESRVSETVSALTVAHTNAFLEIQRHFAKGIKEAKKREDKRVEEQLRKQSEQHAKDRERLFEKESIARDKKVNEADAFFNKSFGDALDIKRRLDQETAAGKAPDLRAAITDQKKAKKKKGEKTDDSGCCIIS
ncbi:hypothetical protein DIPPA_00400 [Diplonema papillatum]|nr:hypothetical protein DIPPA_00400 [Diplonema papillatum]